LHSLYGILDINTLVARGLDPEAVCEAWVRAGVRQIQLRAKSLPSGPLLELTIRLRRLCHAEVAGHAERGAESRGAVEFIVNDRADIAVMAGADGVHLGQDDLKPSEISRMLSNSGNRISPRGPRALRVMGLSTHNLDQLRAGLAEPATYFAIGPVFETGSKANADPVVGLEGVRAAADLLKADGRPLVAIGGITLDRIAPVIAAGASSVAVISDLLTASPGERAQEYLSRLSELPI
jgi:thiamine-phosphate pyrophosphorylase